MKWNHLTDSGKGIAAGLVIFSLYALVSALPGCAALRTSPEVRTVLTVARAAHIGLGELIDFVDGNGGSHEMADAARDALREDDYGKALGIAYMGVADMRARGVPVPEHINRAVYIIDRAMTAQALDELSKAMRATLDE